MVTQLGYLADVSFFLKKNTSGELKKRREGERERESRAEQGRAFVEKK